MICDPPSTVIPINKAFFIPIIGICKKRSQTIEM